MSRDSSTSTDDTILNLDVSTDSDICACAFFDVLNGENQEDKNSAEGENGDKTPSKDNADSPTTDTILTTESSIDSGENRKDKNSAEGEDGYKTASKDDAGIPKEDNKKGDEAYHLKEMKLFINTTRIQHRLAKAHYQTLGILCHSGPLIWVALISGVLSFLSASVGEGEEIEPIQTNSTLVVNIHTSHGSQFITPHIKELFIIIVGILSLVHVTIQKVGQSCNFAARSDMHEQVVLSLGILLEKILFEETKHALNEDIEENRSKDRETRERCETLVRFQAIYDQAARSCTSSMPLRITQGFKHIDHRVDTFLRRKKRDKEMDDVRFWKNYASQELCRKITNRYLWYLSLPNAKKLVEEVEEKMEKEWDEMEKEWGMVSDGGISRGDGDDCCCRGVPLGKKLHAFVPINHEQL